MSDAELSDIADEDEIVRLHENVNDEAEEDGNQDVNVSGEEVKEDDENEDKKNQPPPKKRITRKLFVLNTERLKGPKGVHTIEKLYEGFKFKGKGHEKEDLDRVMKRLEYWAFRLYPKLDFDDFLAKCEHLGHKKDLQTHLKKYRLGMISADDTFAQNDIIEDDNDMDPIIARTESELLAQIANDDFQRLFDEAPSVIETTQLVEHAGHTEQVMESTQHIERAEPTEQVTKLTQNLDHVEYTEPQVTESTERIEHAEHTEPQVAKSTEDIGRTEPTESTEHIEHVENTEPQVTESTEHMEYAEHTEPQVAKSTEDIGHTEHTEPQVTESTKHIENTEPQVTESTEHMEYAEHTEPQITESTEHTEHAEHTEKDL